MTRQKDLLRFNRQLDKAAAFQPEYNWDHVPAIFVISTGRTGTHFFANFFQEFDKRVFAQHEPDLDVFDLNIQMLKKKISVDQAVQFLQYARSEQLKRMQSEGKSLYVESNNNLSYLIPAIRLTFSKYKIIHIVRDGRDVARSFYSKMTSGRFTGEVPVYSLIDPRDRIKASFFTDDPFFESWDSLSRFEKCAWAWAHKDARIAAALEGDENSIQVKFEDLFIEQKETTWKELLSFCDLGKAIPIAKVLEYIQASRSNDTKTFKLTAWTDWPEEFMERFNSVAGFRMKELNYV